MLFRNEYRFLSNMYPSPIRLRFGAAIYEFTCAEAAFQACKNTALIGKFTGIDGKTAKRLGRNVSLRDDWEKVKLRCMEVIVREKFHQNTELMEKLKNIPGCIQEDNTWNDTYWGVYKGAGENHLGKILMRIRDDEI